MNPTVRTITRPLLAAILLALVPLVAAQTPTTFEPFRNQPAEQQSPSLNLFEDVERASGDTSSQDNSGPRITTPGGGPQFALVGTSRFGDRYRVSVRDSAGEVITVDAAPGSSAAIPGYPGYRITEVGARHALVQHPSNSPCFDYADQGVTCEDGDSTARLALATAQAIAPEPEPQPRRRGRRDEASETDAQPAQNAEEAPENPFAAALRAARERGEQPDAAAGRTEAQRFAPRRIDPSEVPEGYRLVRTPFGDRVVPQ